ncbi:MAG: UDP-N-acetylmuramate dehydrogenase [SAR324 cluster bacterium]|nr:UDP-N-acetylmuramate dehydrogenase [SAR324 cluster bacterium]
MHSSEPWHTELLTLSLNSKIHWDLSLRRYNTLKIGGPARCFVEVENIDDLKQLLTLIDHHSIPWFLIGKGSNMLVTDAGWPGIVIRLGQRFKSWEVFPENCQVMAGAGLADVTFAQRCAHQGWSGAEFLAGIPGTIGGAVAMNAGAHGTETCQLLKKVWWIDLKGELHEQSVDEIDFSYRHSSINGSFNKIVVRGLFQLRQGNPDLIQQKIKEYKQFREDKQPRHLPNCGSVFKNPPSTPAAKLIEQAGLKGYRIGDAQVSEKHSNFIVNLGHATADDVLKLMRVIQETVSQNYGIRLEPEVQIMEIPI